MRLSVEAAVFPEGDRAEARDKKQSTILPPKTNYYCMEMFIMKKIITLSLALVMVLALFTACGDPVEAELTNFLNVEMVEVTANYEKIKEEVGKWETMEADADFIKSLDEVLLPLCEDSLTKVNAIALETDEVKGVQAKYVKVMETYKEGFETMSSAAKAGDAAKVEEGMNKLGEAVTYLDEYNAALEELAAQFGSEVQY